MKTIKSWFAVVRSVRIQLTRLFFVALGLLLVIEFVLKDMDPIFGWKGATRGADIVAHLLRSYMASYIFFLVGAQWDKIANRKLIAPRVNVRLSSLLLDFNNILVLMCNLKARTSFSQRTIGDIPRIEWAAFINEVFWLREKYKVWTPPCFLHMLNEWGYYGHSTRDESDQILSRFESYDPSLNVLMDVVNEHSGQFIWLENMKDVFKAFDFGDRPDPLPELDSTIFIRCFAMHEALQQGFQLVEYCRKVDDSTMRWQLETIDKLLVTKGEYHPSKKGT